MEIIYNLLISYKTFPVIKKVMYEKKQQQHYDHTFIS